MSADPRFVSLDNALQHFGVSFLHGSADAVTEIPSRLIGNAKGALHLVGAHALLRFTHEIDRNEPLREWQVGIVEDGARHYAELVAA